MRRNIINYFGLKNSEERQTRSRECVHKEGEPPEDDTNSDKPAGASVDSKKKALQRGDSVEKGRDSKPKEADGRVEIDDVADYYFCDGG